MAENRKLDTYDPAEYLSKETEFHDCCLTVGDPSTGEVEEIPVVRSHLVAHSSVFRDMLKDSDLADPTGINSHIKDIRPEIFKLMLKHMYGGGLPELKTMAKEKVLELAICADKYNVGRLLEKTCKQMIPTNVSTVFIPLRFIAYVHIPILVQPVTKLVQEETDQIVQHKEFLNLDEDSVEFIAKQEKLAIEEVVLWRSILKWGKYQAEKRNLKLQNILMKPLANIRFATFTSQQITNEVVAENILSCPEALQLLMSVSNNKIIDIPGLCTSQKKREIFSKEWNVDSYCRSCPQYTWKPDREMKISDSKEDCSSFYVKNESKYDIAVVSLDFKSNDFKDVKRATYVYKCNIEIVKIVDGHPINGFSKCEQSEIVCGESIVMPLKSPGGKYCILEPYASYKFFLKFSTGHPVFRVEDNNSKAKSGNPRARPMISVRLMDQNVHILNIKYKVNLNSNSHLPY